MRVCHISEVLNPVQYSFAHRAVSDDDKKMVHIRAVLGEEKSADSTIGIAMPDVLHRGST